MAALKKMAVPCALGLAALCTVNSFFPNTSLTSKVVKAETIEETFSEEGTSSEEATSLSFADKVAAYTEEYANADYKHLSDTAYIAVTKNTDGSAVYYLTHIIISDSSQIHGALSYDDWGGSRQLPTNLAAEKNAILVTNGSYFSYDTGNPVRAGEYIIDGAIIQDGTTNGYEVCLKSDGTLYTPAVGISASQLLEEGVIHIWGTADPLLISNGEAVTITGKDPYETYPRTAYGMVEPCEYYVITAGEGNYGNGLSFTQLHEKFQALSCTYARALDGGGSASLVFEGTLINSPAAGEERPVVDFVYFTD